MSKQTISRFFFFALICLPITLSGQEILDPIVNPPAFRTEIIEADRGLSAPFLQCVFEDRYGFIWIGTQYGLDRYDGYSFARMSDVVTDGGTTSMEWIWSIRVDHSWPSSSG